MVPLPPDPEPYRCEQNEDVDHHYAEPGYDVSCLYAPDKLSTLELFLEQLVELWKFVDIMDCAVFCGSALVIEE